MNALNPIVKLDIGSSASAAPLSLARLAPRSCGATLAALLLAACGGGGGSTGEATPAPSVAIPALASVSAPQSFAAGSQIAPIVFGNSGGAPRASGGCSASGLPSGLIAERTEDGSSCRITGAPAAAAQAATATLTATNAAGSSSATVSIAVTAAPPAVDRPALASVSAPQSFAAGSQIAPIVFGNSGGAPRASGGCSASGLPSGLIAERTEDGSSCRITGAPAAAAQAATATLTATNAAGSSSATVSIAVTAAPPAVDRPALASVSAPQSFAAGSQIAPIVFGNSGGAPRASGGCSASGLPSGLIAERTEDGSSCRITGAPAAAAQAATATLTATNAAGSSSATVSIAVTAAPSALVASVAVSTSGSTGAQPAAGDTITVSFTTSAPAAVAPQALIGGQPAVVSQGANNTQWTATVTVGAGFQSNAGGFGLMVSLPQAGDSGEDAFLSATVPSVSSTPEAVVLANSTVLFELAPDISLAMTSLSLTAESMLADVVLVNRGGGSLFPDDASPRGCGASPALPTGIVISRTTDGDSCVITGTPSQASVEGAYTVTARNSAGSSQLLLSIVVAGPALALPDLDDLDASSPRLIAGEAIATPLRLSNSGGGFLLADDATPVPGCAATGLPAGLTVQRTSDGDSCEVSGAPEAGSVGDHTAVVTAVNATGTDSSPAMLSLSVLPAPPSLATVPSLGAVDVNLRTIHDGATAQVVLLQGSAAVPSAADLKSDAAAITLMNLVAGEDAAASFTSLSDGQLYRAHALISLAGRDSAVASSTPFTTLSRAMISAIGVSDVASTTATLAFTSDTAGDYAVLALPASEPPPMAPGEVKSPSSASGAVSANGQVMEMTPVQAQLAGLAAGTAYIAYIVVSSSSQGDSAIASTVEFTTNALPLANAGDDRSVAPDATVSLDGSASRDSDGSIVSYLWSQDSGTMVRLNGASMAVASFEASMAAGEGEELGFSLTVTDDDGASASDSVTITVESAVPVLSTDTSMLSLERGVVMTTLLLANSGAGGLNSIGHPTAPGCVSEPDLPVGLILGLSNDGDSCQISGIPEEVTDTPVMVAITANNPVGASRPLNLVISVVDTAAPSITLDATPVSAASATAATVSFTVSEPGTASVVVAERSQMPPSVADVKSMAAEGAGVSLPVPEAGAVAVPLSGLMASTAYTIYIVFSDSGGNDAPLASAQFETTATTDMTAPMISAVSVTNVRAASANIIFVSDESGAAFMLLLPASELPPAVAAVKAPAGFGAISATARALAGAPASAMVVGLESGQSYIAYLVVTDAADNDSDVASSQSFTANTLPIADAGSDQVTIVGATVTLDGSASSDSNGTIASYLWEQVSGTAVVLSDVAVASPSFDVGAALEGERLEFSLRVTDDAGDTHSATVAVIVNTPPLARTGGDRTVTVGTVTLDASASADAEDDAAGTALSYMWAQTAGGSVTLSDPTAASPTFEATVGLVGQTLVFTLTVTDSHGTTATATVSITVNASPVASAGSDRTVNVGTVTLDASASADAEDDAAGTALSYMWAQTAGAAVTLSDPTAASPTFEATAEIAGRTLAFTLTVTDSNAATATATVSITVNASPVASAGSDRTVNVGTVTLDASASADAEDDAAGTALSYMWAQTAGAAVTLSDAAALGPTFEVAGSHGGQMLTFTLTVTDSNAATDTATVSITVNASPVASAGSDRLVNVGTVTLDASASADAEDDAAGTALSYMWAQDAGAAVTLSDPAAASPTFKSTAGLAGQALAFTLTVTDSNGATDTATVSITVNASPLASAGPDQRVNVGATVTLDASASADAEDDAAGTALSYAWAQDADPAVTLSDAAALGLTFEVAGSHGGQTLTFTLTVTDSNGATDTDTVSISVNASPVASAGSDRSALVGTVTLDASASADAEDDAAGTALSYAWAQDAGPAVTLSDAAAASPTFEATAGLVGQTLTFTLTVTDSEGATDTATVSITINVPPVASAGTAQLVNVGAIVTLDASASADAEDDAAGTSLSYAWTHDAGADLSLSDPAAASPTFEATAGLAGQTLTFTLTVTDSGGATGTDTVSITVNVPPVASAGTAQLVNVSATVTLDASASADAEDDAAGTALSYAWAQDAGPAVTLSDAAAASPTFEATAEIAGSTLAFTLTITDSNGSTDTDTVSITINASPVASAGSDRIVNVGTVTLDASASADAEDDAAGTALSYAWAQDAGPAVTLSDAAVASPTFEATAGLVGQTLTFTLTVTDSNAATDTDTVSITVNALPVASAGPAQLVNVGATVTLDASASADAEDDAAGTALSYAWAQDAGPAVTLSDAAVASPTFEATAEIAGSTLAFTLTVTDSNGATDTDTVSITINASPVASVGSDRTVNVGATVTLDASASADAEDDAAGTALSYAWAQDAGAAVTLSDTAVASPTFEATAGLVGQTLTFTLTVTDSNAATDTDTVSISVNALPVASAGTAQLVNVGATVTLDASASADAEDDAAGTALSYAWAQDAGAAVTLSDAAAASPTFEATESHSGQTLTFTLTVTDSNGATDSATTTVVVNASPVADAGQEQALVVGATVTLDASASADAEDDAAGTALSYMWVQTSGADITLSSNSVAQPQFHAAESLLEETLAFNLVVTDSEGAQDTDTVRILITQSADVDGDGLIEVHSLLDLHNMRYDLRGSSRKSSSTAVENSIGCPESGCIGYELMANLDFNRTSNGRTWFHHINDYEVYLMDVVSPYHVDNGELGIGWLPIGCAGVGLCRAGSSQAFTAIFEGNGHVISNLVVSRRISYIGMFAEIGGGAEIRNLGLHQNLARSSVLMSPEDTTHNIGGLVGLMRGGLISNCYATGVSRGHDVDTEAVGGLVGRMNGGRIVGSYSSSVVDLSSVRQDSGNDSGGGLVGWMGGGIIESSYSTGAVVVTVSSHAARLGGLVGHQMGGIIINSRSSATATGANNSQESIGGLVGFQSGGSIVASFSSGAVDGSGGNQDYVGGLVGFQLNASITASYATGQADGGAGTNDNVGGLVGRQLPETGAATITASYATGNATGGEGDNDLVGGLVGRQNVRTGSTATITASYATGSADGGVGETAGYTGALVGRQDGVVDDSWGFGATMNGANQGSDGDGSAPGGVTSVAALTTASSAGSDVPASWGLGAAIGDVWDFGTASQAPALKFADYDGASANAFHCASAVSETAPAPSGAALVPHCGELIPNQRPLPAPMGAAIAISGDHTISLTWAADPEATYYRVFRAEGAMRSQATQISTDAQQDEASFEDTGLQEGVAYHYWVQACYDALCGADSESAALAASSFQNPILRLPPPQSRVRFRYEIGHSHPGARSIAFDNWGADITGCTAADDDLPMGMAIDSNSCALTGSPSRLEATTTSHIITASSALGSDTVALEIHTHHLRPPQIQAPGATLALQSGSASGLPLALANTGGRAETCDFDSDNDAGASDLSRFGLAIGALADGTACELSLIGATVIAPSDGVVAYSLSARNAVGLSLFELALRIDAAVTAPSALAADDTSARSFPINRPITSITFSATGEGLCSIAPKTAGDPALPEGLAIDPISCAISGTPREAVAATAYTVTRSFGTNSATAEISIAVTESGTPTLAAPARAFALAQGRGVGLPAIIANDGATPTACTVTLPTGAASQGGLADYNLSIHPSAEGCVIDSLDGHGPAPALDGQDYSLSYQVAANNGDGAGAAVPVSLDIRAPAAMQVALSEGATCAISPTTRLYCWGEGEDTHSDYRTSYNLGVGPLSQPLYRPAQVGTATGWKYISGSRNHFCAIRGEESQLWCWGRQSVSGGSLGIGHDDDVGAPVRAGVEEGVETGVEAGWTHVSAGSDHSCGIHGAEGRLYCWGSGGSGQTGLGGNGDTDTPRQLALGDPIESGWTDVSAGNTHSCAIRGVLGHLYCWGEGSSGRTGLGHDKASNFPQQVAAGGSSESGWTDVSAGFAHSCAIRAGELHCWGSNLGGRLGFVASAIVSSPRRVGSKDDWVSVFVHYEGGCAIDEAGQLFCWGDNRHGQLGVGNTLLRTLPAQVGPGQAYATGWRSAIRASFDNILHGRSTQRVNCAVRRDDDEDQLWCWGSNAFGQFGNGTGAGGSNVPLQQALPME